MDLDALPTLENNTNVNKKTITITAPEEDIHKLKAQNNALRTYNTMLKKQLDSYKESYDIIKNGLGKRELLSARKAADLYELGQEIDVETSVDGNDIALSSELVKTVINDRIRSNALMHTNINYVNDAIKDIIRQ